MKFDSYHPTINLIFFVSVITMTIVFQHPIYVAMSYICSFVYSVKLIGKKALIYNFSLWIVMLGFLYYYVSFFHKGVTEITRNYVNNVITLESLVYGCILSLIIASVLMWINCFHKVMSTDKVVYLFGRIAPKLSLFIAILLRTVPRVKTRVGKISLARDSIGYGLKQGNILRRFVNLVKVISIIITWTLEDFVQTSDSMKCRGYGLKGRTSFSIYRFDNRDRSFVITIFWSLTLMLMAVLFNQTDIYYYPQILANKITIVSYLFYIVYAFLSLLPMGLQIAGERKFDRLYKNIEKE